MSDCATCTERQGYYLDAETIANQQQRIADLEGQVHKLKTLHGELCAEVNEKTKKIRKLESLARDMDYCLRNHMCCDDCEIRPCCINDRLMELKLIPRR
jgi:predicted RNase H-like nuclease (RuvC/YqgF family)